jgi:hypothetical protein
VNTPWQPTNPWHLDAAFAVCCAFGWRWVDIWLLQVFESVADLATFEIAKALGSHFGSSEVSRIRWWRIYSQDPSLYREAAARCWERRADIAKHLATT